MTLAIETHCLTKNIKGKKVIDNLSIQVEMGDIYGFLGLNGAGKTMTIRLLTGLIKPSDGIINICGYNLHKDYVQAIANVGAIVEQPVFLNYMTGKENLLYLARLSGVPDANWINTTIEMVDAGAYIDKKVATYSLGMRQRLGIAQSLIHRPRIVIYDEPTNGLDPQGMKLVRDIILNLAKEENLTVFISTHLLSEVELMCNRVGVIHQGMLLLEGNVSDLLEEKGPIQYTVSVDRTEDLRQFLSSLPDIESVRNFSGAILVTIKEGSSIDLSTIIVQEGFRLKSIVPKHATLESIFLQNVEEKSRYC